MLFKHEHARKFVTIHTHCIIKALPRIRLCLSCNDLLYMSELYNFCVMKRHALTTIVQPIGIFSVVAYSEDTAID